MHLLNSYDSDDKDKYIVFKGSRSHLTLQYQTIDTPVPNNRY